MTISSAVNQEGSVIVPNEATIVSFNEPIKGQDVWASFQEENPRVGIEPRDFDIHHISGGGGGVSSGHADHGSVRPKGFAKLVGKAFLAREDDFQNPNRESIQAYLRTARAGRRRPLTRPPTPLFVRA